MHCIKSKVHKKRYSDRECKAEFLRGEFSAAFFFAITAQENVNTVCIEQWFPNCGTVSLVIRESLSGGSRATSLVDELQ